LGEEPKISTRVYIESLSKVHANARKIVNKRLIEARSIIEKAISSYKEVYPEEFVGLSALCLDDKKIVEDVPLLLKWDDIRLGLIKRNSELVNLKNRHVTGEVKSV